MKFTHFILMAVSVFVVGYASNSYSQIQSNNHLDWFTMLMWLTGGLALFLYGMEQLVKGLLVVAGNQMKNLLAKLTTNRVMGALTGAGITAVIQSSSVTTVLTVGFVSAGLMSVSQSAGVIMGANLGTTITAQVIAFKVTNFALLMVAVGFAIQFFGKLNIKKATGQLIMGLGLIFFGMNVMSDGMAPLRDYQPFLDLMLQMQNPLLAIVVGLVFTALIQSSSATLGIIIVMASNGFLTLPAGLALAMGAHVGTTVTAMLATIGKSREARRSGLIHLQFNLFGVVLLFPFIPEISQFAAYISSHDALVDVTDMSYLAAHTPREIANANTLFSLICLLIFLPFSSVFIWFVYKLVPIIDEEKGGIEFNPEFLDETFLTTPNMAMQAVQMEIERYQQKQSLFYKRVVNLIQTPNIDKLSKEDLNIQRFRSYQRKILSYVGRLGQLELTDAEQAKYIKLMSVIHSMESMLESIEFNIFQVLHNMAQTQTKPSDTMNQLVGQLSTEVGKSMDSALLSIAKEDQELAMSVIAVKPKIDLLLQDALKHQVKRFQPTEERLNIFRYEMQLIDGFKQLHTLCKRIARLELVDKHDEKNISLNAGSQNID